MSPEDNHKMIAEMFLTVQRLESEIKALRAQVGGHPAIADGWMTAADAAIALKPEGIKSARHLQRLRLNGAFSESKREIDNRSEGERPTWYYHVPSCRKALQGHFRRTRAV